MIDCTFFRKLNDIRFLHGYLDRNDGRQDQAYSEGGGERKILIKRQFLTQEKHTIIIEQSKQKETLKSNTMSPTYEQGQVRDAMITHLPLFCCHLKALRHTGRTPFRRQRSQKV